MFYYDGSSSKEIKDLFETGIISGVTTNISHIKSALKNSNKTETEILKELASCAQSLQLPISIQLKSKTVKEMIREASEVKELVGNYSGLYLKIAANFANLSAVRQLSNDGYLINATCVTSWMQGKMMALSGAKVISFFWGKMSDQGLNPYHHVNYFSNWRVKSKSQVILLVGSVRQTASIQSAFESGADVVTTSKQNLEKIANQLTSDAALDLFNKDLMI